jgi:hypothetical protein
VSRRRPASVITLHVVASDDEGDSRPREHAYLADAAARLIAETSAALSDDRWAIINNGSDNAIHRLYDAAALRHTAGLLRSISHNAQRGDEFAVRILGRSHTEAWLTGTYLHFGGPEALDRIAADTLDETTTTHEALQRYDKELAEAKKKTRKKLKAIRKANEGIRLWNTRNPDKPPKPLHKEPRIPQQAKAGIDLSTRISNFPGIQSQDLSLSEITEALTKLGPEKGFAYENFTHIYLHYRLNPATSVHPTLHIYDSYFEPPPGYFTHTASQPTGPSGITDVWASALYGTALQVGWVLGDAGQPTPVADQIRDQLKPDPTAGRGWSPGN